ncbi:interferon-inducible double-stranded RNA-dependent protein kinase activator A homolog isoform X1 [Pieris napi]|uniref:interferon-inducible double-stranded RNA-dependent protein kinase activator A homolog isoform X1 n=1 Tax=Pieris napi TaxID=78633 RepID=UPI001FBA0AFC|nr:interferon-inducible double-stranded RNA-dependent protein kinase activator A homolog isoform X1 [Pieris napi]
MMKTAISVLQEMMIKAGEVPEYECIAQCGPQHQATFEYRCKSSGLTVTARARSKKEAKQEAAKRMLAEMFARGDPVPPPYARPPEPPGLADDPVEPPQTRALPSTVSGGAAASGVAVDARSYVALLKELCEQYQAGCPAYDVVGDAGPPHCRLFTVAVKLGGHERRAAASTKKAAKQLAAEHLYKYLRLHLARLTEDFVEEDALNRAHERAMERYVEEKASTFRPPLDQKISEYHLGLLRHLDEDKVASGREAMAPTAEDEDPVSALQTLCAKLGLNVASENVGGLSVVRVQPSAPEVAVAAEGPKEAHAAALRYVRRVLAHRPTDDTLIGSKATGSFPNMPLIPRKSDVLN